MLNLDAYRKALATLDPDIAWAEVNAHENESTLVSVINGEVARTAANLQTAIYVRACGEKPGIAYTQDAAEDAAGVIRRAAENGRYGEGEPPDVLAAPENRHQAKAYEPINLQTLVDIGNRLGELVRQAEPAVAHAKADVRLDTWSNAVLHSKGLDVDASRRVYCASLSVMAQRDGKQYNAQAHVTASTPDSLDLQAAASRVARSLARQYEPVDFPSGVYPVVLDNSVVINIMTTAWQLFTGSKMLNGSSALFGLMDKAVGSGALNITDRPSREGSGYAFPLDDEGIVGKPTSIVQNGIMTGLLHTQATAARMHAATTGNSGRVALLTGSIPTELIPIPRIFCVEPGCDSQDALLAHMGEGVFIAQSYDVFHSINIGSGDFSIPCRGSIVRDGRCVGNVTGMTISGNLRELFMKIVEVGSDLWIDEFLLKSYCIGAPSLRLSSLQVNGKG